MVGRIRELCKEKGITLAELERRCEIGNGIIARWSKSKPSYERLAKVATELETTVEYLTGESGQKEKPTAESGELDPVTREIIKIVEAASDEERRMILNVIKEILRKRDTN